MRIRSCIFGLALLIPVFAPALSAASTEPSGGFVITCGYSHTLSDDPIVFPGQPGASHSHDFFANTSTDANSTYASMVRAPTICALDEDTAGYWSPTAYLDGVQIRPQGRLGDMRIYYRAAGAALVESIPPGLQVIGGDKMATTPPPDSVLRWYCGAGARGVTTPIRDHPYDCTPYAAEYKFVDGVVGWIILPRCWDGGGLEPSHLAYPVDASQAECPTGFPHVLPQVSERVHFGVMDPCAGASPCGPDDPDTNVKLSFSSGPYFTFHADFWNTWQQAKLDELVARCVNAHVHCGFLASQYTLTVSKIGSGSGTVSSEPAGIDCGSSCSASYEAGTEVILSATPDVTFRFVRWGGDCTGNKICTLTMDGARRVKADFEPIPVYRPDAQIKFKRAYTGMDVYNSTGDDQAVGVPIHKDGRRTFFIRIQNDGNIRDGFRILGARAPTGFRVTYLAGSFGSTDITSKVVAGTYTLRDVWPGTSRVMRLVVEATKKARIGTRGSWLISATSTHQSAAGDAVKAAVRVVPRSAR